MKPRYPWMFRLGLALFALALGCWAAVVAGAPALVGATGGGIGSSLAIAALVASQPRLEPEPRGGQARS